MSAMREITLKTCAGDTATVTWDGRTIIHLAHVTAPAFAYLTESDLANFTEAHKALAALRARTEQHE